MRYLYKANIQNAIRDGEQIEQFLRYTKLDGKRIFSWLSLKRQAEDYALLHHKQYAEGAGSRLNIYDLKYLHLPKNRTEPEYLLFSSLDAALQHAVSHFGASNVKWVKHGVVEEEYNDFLFTENDAQPSA